MPSESRSGDLFVHASFHVWHHSHCSSMQSSTTRLPATWLCLEIKVPVVWSLRNRKSSFVTAMANFLSYDVYDVVLFRRLAAIRIWSFSFTKQRRSQSSKRRRNQKRCCWWALQGSELSGWDYWFVLGWGEGGVWCVYHEQQSRDTFFIF